MSAKAFNAFQLMLGFVAWPFLIQYLYYSDFRASGVLAAMSTAFYLPMFYTVADAVYDKLK
jgi:hypothetical protein